MGTNSNTKNNQARTSILSKLNELNLEKAFVTDGKKERKISILSKISIPGPKPRVKTYEVKEDTEWFTKNKIIPLTNKLLVNDLEVQAALISDELNIILDNLKVYRNNYLESGTVIFTNIDSRYF